LALGQHRLALGAAHRLPITEQREVGAMDLLRHDPWALLERAVAPVLQRPLLRALDDLLVAGVVRLLPGHGMLLSGGTLDMRHPSSGLPLHLLTLPLLLGFLGSPAAVRAEQPPPPSPPSALRVALDIGGTLGVLKHPAAVLPPTPFGIERSASTRDSAARATFGVRLALSQFFDVGSLWESNVLDWYLAGDVRVLSI